MSDFFANGVTTPIREATGLRILVDALVLDRQAAGIGQYIRSLLQAYHHRFPEDNLGGFFQPAIALEGIRSYAVPGTHTSARRLWFEQVVLPRRIRHQAYDVVHFPDYQVPLTGQIPRVVMTVHDLAAFRMPEVFPARKSQVKRQLMRWSVPHARRIIVPSQATKQDLVTLLQVVPEKIVVIPHGVKPLNPDLGAPRVYHRPYFLAVGTVEPRKNFSGLIRAYHLLCQRKEDVPDLVIAGRLGWMYEQTLELPTKLGVAERVKFLQYVSEGNLAVLYRDAVAMVYPSFYEGFGLPVVEAMQMGIPVVTSGQGALGELGRDEVWRVEPSQIESIAYAMQSVLEADQGSLLARTDVARTWASQLTWERTAEQTRRVYLDVSKEGG